ncbi:hypothetical protein [Peribacillus frigoritolerans]
MHWTHNIESVAGIVKHLSGNMISQGGMTFKLQTEKRDIEIVMKNL